MNSGPTSQRSNQSLLRQNRILISIAGMLGVFGLSVFFYLPAYANIISLPEIDITVYFEKDRKPHDKPVDFTIYCYGFWEGPRPVTFDPATDEIIVPQETEEEELFSLSGTCHHYGCEIDGPSIMPWFEVTYCDCEGETEGQRFTSEDRSLSRLDPICRSVFDDESAFGGEVVLCELRFNIPTSSEAADSDGNGETTDSDKDEDNDGGCFITTLLQP